MDKLLGFTPDMDPTTPGVVTECVNFIPYINGMRGAPTGSTPASTPALAAACQGIAVTTRLDDTRRYSQALKQSSTNCWQGLGLIFLVRPIQAARIRDGLGRSLATPH